MSGDAGPLRILYSFSDTLGLTGIGAIAWHQIDGLVRSGARVHVFAPRCAHPVPGVAELTETMRPLGCRLPLRRLGPINPRLLHDWITARALAARRDRIDLVHCWPGTSLRTLKAAQQSSIATFLERPNTHTRFARDVVRQEHERLGVPLPRSHSHAISDRRLALEEAEYTRAERLLCPSEFVARTFLSLGFAPERIARHQYGCDTAAFRPSLTALRSPPGSLEVAFVGRCEPRKGLHYALPAWLGSSASTRGKFHICGDFVPGYREALAPWLKHTSIVEHGFVKDVAAVLQNCDALVLSSVEEGSALVTYEARACGCVLLVSEATGAICEHGQTGLVHPVGDINALRNDFNLLDSHGGHLNALRCASLAELHELTWDRATERLLNAYQQRRQPPRTEPAVPAKPPSPDTLQPIAP